MSAEAEVKTLWVYLKRGRHCRLIPVAGPEAGELAILNGRMGGANAGYVVAGKKIGEAEARKIVKDAGLALVMVGNVSEPGFSSLEKHS
jgi:hypothetical protein